MTKSAQSGSGSGINPSEVTSPPIFRTLLFEY